jgi:autotransporter-associated beta strand repeat
MKLPHLLASILLASTVTGPGPVRAANYYWDATPDGGTTLNYGSGVISTSAANWWPASGAAYVGWTNSLTDSINIGSAGSVNGKTYESGAGVPAFTLTLDGAISAQQVLMSGALNSGNPVTISDGGNAANTLTLANSGNVGNNSATSVLIIDAQIQGGGANGIGKINGGTVVFLKDNTYAGATMISGQVGAGNGGVLQIGNGGTTGSLGTGAVQFALNGAQTEASTLRFYRSDALTVNNAMSILSANGVGGIVQHAGGDTLTLGGNVVLGTTGAAVSAVLTYDIADTAQVVDTQVTGNISGIGGVAKTGAGRLIFSGSNSYTGETRIHAGTLVVNGFNGNSAFTVNGSGELAGVGTVGALTVQGGGVLTPGDGAGILRSGAFSLASGGTLAVSLSGDTVSPVAGIDYTQLSATGAVSLTGDFSLTLEAGYVHHEGALYFVLENDSSDAISGAFNGLADNAILTVDGYDFRISYFGDSATNSFTGGNDVVLMAVPEPSGLLLGTMALGWVVVRRWSRRWFPES